MREILAASKTSVRKTQDKGKLGKLRDMWEDNIKMDHTEIGCEDFD
jgi:hypothetical protein